MHVFSRLHHFLAKKKFVASLRRKQFQSIIQTFSDQSSQKDKSFQYNNLNYEIRLKQKSNYMRNYNDIDNNDTIKNMKTFCKTLLKNDQTIFQNFLFRDDLFKRICEKIRNKNETIIVQNIIRLIVFSTENLAIYDTKHLNHFYEIVNENWNNTVEYKNILLQSNYSIEFERSAFIQKQLNKFKFFVNEFEFKITIYFMTITRIYFSFFICEIKCDAVVFDFVDRQNVQNMNFALKVLVVFFKWIKREKELNRKIFIFFVSHDHRFVKIYDHYFVIENDKITFYRHSIHTFDFTTLDGKKNELPTNSSKMSTIIIRWNFMTWFVLP